ncbi:restriction endonuclease [Elizabethkingia anophelis]|nr:restriction endonuclease subunit S [Elizabethkingia anophelis]MDV3870437.1 restriction endonuclease [Elizabethkingia anophelis]MDV3962287.1 restriction endonuclease [Elizabethkingia anophelis]
MRFPEFTEEWETKKLGEILEFKNGINATKEQYGSGYKFINVLDILNNEFITHDKIIGSVNVNEEIIDKFPVNYGDILFQRSSETREEVGTTSVYLDKDKTATFGGFVIRGKKNGEYEPIFLNKSLKTDLVRNQITSKSGGSTRYNIGQEILASVTLYFPSLNEQTKIASFLSLIDSRIQTQNKIIEQLETLIKGLSEKLFSQEIRFKEFTDKWELKKLGDISTITTGSSNREDSMLNGEYTFFDRSQDIRTSSRFLFDKEAVIVPGEGQEFIPKYFIGKFDLHQRTYAIFDFSGIYGKYFYYHLLNDDKYLQSQAVGSTVKSLRLPMLQSMPIKSPCLDEQTTIANFLSVIETKIQTEKNILDKYHSQKQYLLQNLFI